MPEIALKPRALIRQSAEDFIVEEIPAYLPSGAGQHLYITFTKREITTYQAVQQISRALNVNERDIGSAGLKDRHGVTTQTVSVQFPEAAELPSIDALSSETLRVTSMMRHANKLKTGHLKGNRFEVVLRGIDPSQVFAVCDGFSKIAEIGLPNRFGAQRFGHGGDNAEVAARWIEGKASPPRDRKVKRLMFSAWQSALFHKVLDRRIEDGTWNQLLEGDLAQRGESGRTWHWVPGDDSGERAVNDEPVVATGPMYGVKMRWPTGTPGDIEREILQKYVENPTVLARWASLGEGARRPLKLAPSVLRAEPLSGEPGSVRVECVLPAGAYVTSVLEAVCETVDVSRPGAVSASEQGSVAERADEEQDDP